jgi:Bacterial regulatory proteins, luxR family
MPRYFFHVKRGQVTVLDQEGIDLENSAQAEEEAVRRTQQCLADDALNGMPISRGISSGMIIVADENWRRVFELLFWLRPGWPMQEEKRLSDRQTSVVRLVAEGRTNKEIGRILNITLKTVQPIEQPPCGSSTCRLSPISCATPFAMV